MKKNLIDWLGWIFTTHRCPRCGHVMKSPRTYDVKVCPLCLTAMDIEGVVYFEKDILLFDRNEQI